MKRTFWQIFCQLFASFNGGLLAYGIGYALGVPAWLGWGLSGSMFTRGLDLFDFLAVGTVTVYFTIESLQRSSRQDALLRERERLLALLNRQGESFKSYEPTA